MATGVLCNLTNCVYCELNTFIKENECTYNGAVKITEFGCDNFKDDPFKS